MNKAFTKETDIDDEPADEDDILPANKKNYVTPHGLVLLKKELHMLLSEERPKVVDIVSWAAGNGDRSENGDYIYGKRRLREIDRRIRYLTKRVENAEVVDPRLLATTGQVIFGATIEYRRMDGRTHQVTIVGIDEADLADGKMSWLSPVARALMKARAGDKVDVQTPSGPNTIEILSVHYGFEDPKA
jgi:transcription elongation factor GreB